ncbi:uncharacterized protein [Asterias amurensis]|uniref:uncharacterized protein n=1 Tax=Asterias amurensis TaxID=7602 RepID=UPI003AB878C6
MAIAGQGSKGSIFIMGDEKADSLTVLQRRFPEIPVDVVSGILQKNDGNMSRSIEDLEQTSAMYMYGDFVSSDQQPHMVHTTTISGTNNNVIEVSMTHSPALDERTRADSQGMSGQLVVDVDQDETPKSSFTSWASLDTGFPDGETPTSSAQNSLSFYKEPKHLSLVTVDIKEPTQRTESPSEVSRPPEGDVSPMQNNPHKRNTNGFQPIVSPHDYPFEPRPNAADSSTGWHLSPSGHRTLTHIQPVELHATTQIATSYQLDPLKPSSPATRPAKGSRSPAPVATYNKANDSTTISVSRDSPRTSKKSSISTSLEEDASPLLQDPPEGPSHSIVDPNLQDARRKSRVKKNRNHLPPEPGRSLSKEEVEKSYTESLLMHQKARFERLCKELEEERRNLNEMKILTAQMEREVGNKLNHRSPYPKPEEIGRLREQKRQLQIDIECMNREIDLHKSQGLMDLAQANSFYGNMGSTGAPGPIPPMSPTNSFPESTSPLSPPYTPTVLDPEEAQKWSCSACTLLNHPALDKCECCEMPRDK